MATFFYLLSLFTLFQYFSPTSLPGKVQEIDSYLKGRKESARDCEEKRFKPYPADDLSRLTLRYYSVVDHDSTCDAYTERSATSQQRKLSVQVVISARKTRTKLIHE